MRWRSQAKAHRKHRTGTFPACSAQRKIGFANAASKCITPRRLAQTLALRHHNFLRLLQSANRPYGLHPIGHCLWMTLDYGKPCMCQTTRSVSASQLAYEWKNNDKRCWRIRGQGPTPLSQRIPLCYDISGGKRITIVTSENRCSGHNFILGYHRWILL